MLFVLDKSLADQLKEHPDDEIVLQALFYIALGRREGKNRIFAEHQYTLKAFHDSEHLDKSSRAVYQFIDKNWSTKGAYYERLIRRVRVTADKGIKNISWMILGKTKEIVIPAHFISDSYFIQKTVLLCENLTDCKIYERMAEVSMIWQKKGKVNLAYEPRGGGGSTTADEYQQIQKSRSHLCLCISESDKKYPNAPTGETAGRLKKAEKADQSLTECIIIEFREIENLIPAEIYKQVSTPDRIKFINFLEKIEKSQWPEAAGYIDFKKGLTGKEWFRMENNNPDWWKNFLNSVRPLLSDKCRTEKTCLNPENCDCIITTGMGDKVLDAAVGFFALQTSHITAKLVSDHLKPHWQEYGELIAAWCCAGSRISV